VSDIIQSLVRTTSFIIEKNTKKYREILNYGSLHDAAGSRFSQNFASAPEDLSMELLPIVRVTSLTAVGSLLLSLGSLSNRLRISVSNCAILIAAHSQPPVLCVLHLITVHMLGVDVFLCGIAYRFMVHVMLI